MILFKFRITQSSSLFMSGLLAEFFKEVELHSTQVARCFLCESRQGTAKVIQGKQILVLLK